MILVAILFLGREADDYNFGYSGEKKGQPFRAGCWFLMLWIGAEEGT
jgi:hypothetical protein